MTLEEAKAELLASGVRVEPNKSIGGFTVTGAEQFGVDGGWYANADLAWADIAARRDALTPNPVNQPSTKVE